MIKRRDFIKASAAAGISLNFSSYASFGDSDNSSLLLEAVHFEKTNGWEIDTQFHNTLGFSYLLAHGLGRPVKNAQTKARFEKAGLYNVWVHTKDWCPGDWDAPGRFKLKVGGEYLNETFGIKPGWKWHYGGKVEVNQSEVQIELEDLTGFEGRCSAVYFTQDDREAPPNDKQKLVSWRLAKNPESSKVPEKMNFDVVITGGGISGCAAALAAESQGLKVALIHNRPALGGNASAEIRVHTLGILGGAEDILKKINTEHYPNGSDKAFYDEQKRTKNMNEADGISQFLMHTVISADAAVGQIKSIQTYEHLTGRRTVFKAANFIDCTGDGWLGRLAGADFTYGREPESKYNEGWEKHGDLWCPEKADNRVMGASVLWNTEIGEENARFPEVPWAKPVAKDHTSAAGEWYWEYSHNSLNQIDDAEQIRDHFFRAIYGTYSNTIKQDKHKKRRLTWVGYNAGKRESIRLTGDYVYTGEDAAESVEFEDAVVVEKRSIDIHYQRSLKGSPYDFLSEAIFRKAKNKFYYIPFRSLYSHNVKNLMMAGRCFSCSHVGLGGPRVMNTCGQMGAAVGFAAALSRKYNKTARKVGREHIGELLKLCRI
ncbi:FAD-dependent oxidoreductase [Sedimentisphaera salicampi]|uniref:Anaerobic glycerol-3-phosphate dehydrogenase subunit B n=1 Tax=Sedimentisphaera salicampi TaxID=1941349 RepID=A0A1W6LMN2_9BACT|nr:FAD-dependent oxidoreductase [Sedimentisphaera salicampi]ARN57035.1 anaerobic glycerol-3-phosphate dehydrogenase subunit B [Sedimentisphaera salicampi]